jgi:hypothetical protein
MYMAEGKRPGGLTALAVINFVFGGLGALGLLAVLALLGVAKNAGANLSDAKVDGASVSAGAIYLALGIGVISVTLLIAAGVGYIKQRKWGKTMGTAYGVLALVNTGVGLVLLKQGFGLMSIVGLILPLLNLIMANTTFKDDLVN